MEAQHKAGRLILAGPFVGGGSRAGLVVYRAASADEARGYATADPMVKFGRLEAEYPRVVSGEGRAQVILIPNP